ncbi:MAG: NAD(P)-dependent oxidoreductase [Saprospiraceae bacterium]
MAFHVLITDKVHPVLISDLKAKGAIVTYDTSVNNEILDNIIHRYDGIIINSKITMDEARIKKGIQLKFIGRLGSGLEIIDLKAAKRARIEVLNSPEGNRNAVSEHALGMLLALANNLYRSNHEVKTFHWDREKNRGFELEGKTIGIIGFGHTGSSFAEKLSSWRLNIIAYDKYKKRFGRSFRFVERTSLDTLLERSDIISVHLPLTNETKNFIDRIFLSKCKNGVILINTSRGQILNTRDLIDALESKKIGGACLDVFENEKPETYSDNEKMMFEKLYSFENILVSPHVAGWTHESLYKIAKILSDKILQSSVFKIS